MYFPSGTYLVVTENFPFRNLSSTTGLLDCHDMTIFGDGPSTILKTSSVLGADVLQLNALKNFHVRNLKIQSVISGTYSGSNGISITNGYDNLTFDNVWCYNLAYVDKTTYIDGGKALTIQTPNTGEVNSCGSLKATNFYADGCVYGFDYEPDNYLSQTMSTHVEVDIVASNCWIGVLCASPASNGTLNDQMTNGCKVRAQTVNCGIDVGAGRTFGLDVECQIITTKTQTQLLNSYLGTPWSSAYSVSDIQALNVTYAKNSRFAITGNKKNCYHKATIGGAFDGSSGLNGATEYCDFYLDITGTSTSVDVQYNDAGGNVITNCRIYSTKTTTLTYPSQFYATIDCTLTIGAATTINQLTLNNYLSFGNGVTDAHIMYVLSGVLATRQLTASGANTLIQEWVSDAQVGRLGIRNDGCLSTSYGATATSVATVKSVYPIYDMSGNLLGYIPIYTSYA